jgi:hypothetical protein
VFTDFGWPLHIITNKQTKKLIRAASLFVRCLFAAQRALFLFARLATPTPKT